MRFAKLSDMTRGWFVGSFEPTVLNAPAVEVAIKRYKAGDTEEAHYHKISTEVSCVASGRIKINGYELIQDDILVLEAGDMMTGLYAIEDTALVVVKYPVAKDDKWPIEKTPG